MIGSSLAQDGCVMVAPVVSSNAVDDAGYFQIFLGIFGYEYTEGLSLFDHPTG
jgi:hypothetical protein